MSRMFFILIFSAVIIIDLVLASLCLHTHRSASGRLAAVMGFAAMVAASYMVSIIVSNFMLMSIMSSLYFCFVDLMLFSLVLFSLEFTGVDRDSILWRLTLTASILMVLDLASLLLNPIFYHAFHFVAAGRAVLRWGFEFSWPYRLHLAFCYLLIVCSVLLLLRKAVTSPSVYRRRYAATIAGVVGVVLLNIAFLLHSALQFDFSIVFYSAAGVLIYCAGYPFADNALLNQTRKIIFGNMPQPIVLFDYEQCFVQSNQAAERIGKWAKLHPDITLSEFMDNMNFYSGLTEQESASFPIQYYDGDAISASFRCDYTRLQDHKQRVLGYLFILTDNSLETDLLTGFRSPGRFKQDDIAAEPSMRYPATVAIYDINRLAEINRSRGSQLGDQVIRALANEMRCVLPEGTLFYRLEEANLMAVAPNTDTRTMRALSDRIASSLLVSHIGRIEVQSAVCTVQGRETTIQEAAEIAAKSMRARKLLDHSSAHTSLLDSLAQAQLESDGTTEEHVRRTHLMGQKLGLQMGLSDSELSQLALLCLLHDIGKLGIPLEILDKPGKLTSEEWDVMKSHAEKGYRIAKASSELAPIADYILHHHESWDGSGYPDGLKGEAIPRLSRIIAVVDSFDAMTNDRPYRKAITYPAAIEELQRCAGTQLDPNIVAEFIRMLQVEYPEEMLLRPDPEASISDMPMGIIEVSTASASSGNITPLRYAKYIMDSDNRILRVNREFEELTGYSQEDLAVYDLHHGDLLFPEDSREYDQLLENILRDNPEAYIEHRIRRKDGSPRFVFCYGKQYFDSVSHEPRAEVVITDIATTSALQYYINSLRSSMQRSTQNYQTVLRRDSLTGILNHAAYRNDVQMMLFSNTTTVLMLMLDADNFKDYNDTYGHPAGDALLIHLAQALQELVQEDGFACRMGGDEFSAVCVLPGGADPAAARRRAEQIYHQLTLAINAFHVGTSVSVGAAISGEGRADFQQLYEAADRALYQAKAGGKGRIFCDI